MSDDLKDFLEKQLSKPREPGYSPPSTPKSQLPEILPTVLWFVFGLAVLSTFVYFYSSHSPQQTSPSSPVSVQVGQWTEPIIIPLGYNIAFGNASQKDMMDVEYRDPATNTWKPYVYGESPEMNALRVRARTEPMLIEYTLTKLR